jgi:hypothetical protein
MVNTGMVTDILEIKVLCDHKSSKCPNGCKHSYPHVCHVSEDHGYCSISNSDVCCLPFVKKEEE